METWEQSPFDAYVFLVLYSLRTLGWDSQSNNQSHYHKHHNLHFHHKDGVHGSSKRIFLQGHVNQIPFKKNIKFIWLAPYRRCDVAAAKVTYSWYDGDRNKLKVQSWLPSRQNSLQTSPRTRYKMACRSLSLRLVLISCDRAQKSCRILHDSTTILNSIFFCVCERPKRAILNRFFAVFMLARKKCPVCLNDYNCLKFACMKKRICHPHQALQVNRLLWMILMRNK